MLREFLASLRRPFLFGLGAGMLMAALSLGLRDYYTSTATLLPVQKGGGGGVAASLAAFGVALPGQEGGDGNYVDILQSRWMAERLLQSSYEFRWRSWRYGREGLRSTTLGAHLKVGNGDQGYRAIRTRLKASLDRRTGVVAVAFESDSADLSHQVMRRAMGLLEEFLRHKLNTRGSDKAAFAEARLAEAHRDLDKSEAELHRFLAVNRNYATSVDPTVRLRGGRLEAELQLRRQLVTTLAVSQEQALMEARSDVPVLNILDGGHLPAEKSRPNRSQMVLGAMFLVALGAWAWINRSVLLAKLKEGISEGKGN